MITLPEDFASWSLEAKQAFNNKLKYDWRIWAREKQLPPPGDWDGWILLSGRGFGKSRAANEFVKMKLMEEPGCRVGVCSMTIGSARDVNVEGEGGLLSIIPPDDILKWNRSLGQLRLKNGSSAFMFGSTDPDRLRGFQCNYFLFDELAAFSNQQMIFDMALMTLRLGSHPQWLVATTPRPTPLIMDLVAQAKAEPERIRLVTGSTFENTNLPDATLRSLRARYEGTSIGRQELLGALVFDAAGALWNRELLDKYRIPSAQMDDVLGRLTEIVVGVDPSMSKATERPTECGIVVVARGENGHGYVLEDASLLRPSPETWANQVVRMFHKYKANTVVAEMNQGGDLVKHTIQMVDKLVPVKMVSSQKNKRIRAEPIVALYEQGKMHHVGEWPELEDQCVQWVPDSGAPSPDRIDALVHAFTKTHLGGGLAEYFTAEGIGRLPDILSGNRR